MPLKEEIPNWKTPLLPLPQVTIVREFGREGAGVNLSFTTSQGNWHDVPVAHVFL